MEVKTINLFAVKEEDIHDTLQLPDEVVLEPQYIVVDRKVFTRITGRTYHNGDAPSAISVIYGHTVYIGEGTVKPIYPKECAVEEDGDQLCMPFDETQLIQPRVVLSQWEQDVLQLQDIELPNDDRLELICAKIITKVGALMDETKSKLDNMPDGLRYGLTGLLQERIGLCEETIIRLGDIPFERDKQADDWDEERFWSVRANEIADALDNLG